VVTTSPRHAMLRLVVTDTSLIAANISHVAHSSRTRSEQHYVHEANDDCDIQVWKVT
jgi:hypothetical protein